MKTIKRYSQNADILLHLVKGKKITRLAGLTIFGVQNITARISELREVSHRVVYGCTQKTRTCDMFPVIEGEIKFDANGQEYASYSIPDREHRVKLGSFLSSLRKRAE